MCDNAAVARMAFRELSAGMPPCLAAVPSPGLPEWNFARLSAFEALCADAGVECRVFDGKRNEDPALRIERLARWLSALPRRSGVFGTNDNAARRGYLPSSAAFAPDAAPRTNAWWTAEAFWNGDANSGGYATRFYVPGAAMSLSGVPERVGFTISFQDDDRGGERDHTLYWTGSHYLPFRNESAFGDIVFEGASGRDGF